MSRSPASALTACCAGTTTPVDILQGGSGLNYASGYQDIAGIIVPATRRVYAYEGDYQLVKEPLLVAIDFSDITMAS